MARQPRKHSKEFKAEVVCMVTDGGKSIAEVSRAHELADSLVHTWVRQARIDAGNGPTRPWKRKSSHGCGEKIAS